MILIIDNYDSFTYNLFQYISEFSDDKIIMKKNNKIKEDEICISKFSHIIISPGPGEPKQSGDCLSIIKKFYKNIPILGVCLGHQAIGEVFGGKIKKHIAICHGKVSTIIHNKSSKLYKGVPEKFQATRYHSLIIDKETLHKDFNITAILHDGTIMGIEHKKYKLYGVQFHPESIETNYGKQIIKNFINIV